MKIKQYAPVKSYVEYRNRKWLLSDRFGGYSYLLLLPFEKPLLNRHLEPITSIRTKESRFVLITEAEWENEKQHNLKGNSTC